ncbi:MAG: hypothetical protein KatS3mg068_1022 [Candidatus Sericytochromatia bacterium]|nr:MAG: hypothetical protein KatS3mg068_1022 [Candidatus Sericytochromatia bacterium]
MNNLFIENSLNLDLKKLINIFITGDALFTINKVRSLINDNDKVLIIEDSPHMVSLNSYFIVKDSIVYNGLNIPYDFDGKPYRAIEEFIKENHNFEIDRSKERFLLTWNPKGFLKRIK